MSRYRVTETRQVIVDLDRYFFPDDDLAHDENAANDIARDMPSSEWDTIDTQVDPL